MPPRPFAPVKFSGLMDRVLAFESRDRLPMFMSSPLKDPDDWAWLINEKKKTTTVKNKIRISKTIFLIVSGMASSYRT
jgi:hypothetical protein